MVWNQIGVPEVKLQSLINITIINIQLPSYYSSGVTA